MDIRSVRVIERQVKYPRLELRTGLPVLVMPRYTNLQPAAIVGYHKKWLEEKLEFVEKVKKKYKNCKIYERSDDELRKMVEKFVGDFLLVIKVKPLKISFRYLKTKWGSCSRKRRLCFNLALKHLPTSLVRYVVFHEMVHLIIPNHKKAFWTYVKKEFENPDSYEEKLYGYWFLINKNQGNEIGNY